MKEERGDETVNDTVDEIVDETVGETGEIFGVLSWNIRLVALKYDSMYNYNMFDYNIFV